MRQEAEYDLVQSYYSALYQGNLLKVKELMVKKSYIMLLESLGVGLAISSKEFKKTLSTIEENPRSMRIIEEKIIDLVISKMKTPNLCILKEYPNGEGRKTVHYEEEGKTKKMYFSKHAGLWKIDYLAGRSISE